MTHMGVETTSRASSHLRQGHEQQAVKTTSSEAMSDWRCVCKINDMQIRTGRDEMGVVRTRRQVTNTSASDTINDKSKSPSLIRLRSTSSTISLCWALKLADLCLEKNDQQIIALFTTLVRWRHTSEYLVIRWRDMKQRKNGAVNFSNYQKCGIKSWNIKTK